MMRSFFVGGERVLTQKLSKAKDIVKSLTVDNNRPEIASIVSDDSVEYLTWRFIQEIEYC